MTLFVSSLQARVSVPRNSYGVNTSFEDISRSESRINLNYEYDALLKISHTCCHNLIATNSVADFLAQSRLRMELKTKGRIQLLGPPVEESCGGKASWSMLGLIRVSTSL
jgi:metal-dependent amidase/aminoacylase/carboxypeptidase family protein